MSGVYLVVWEPERILEATKGGHPHVTVFYSGDRLRVDELVPVAQKALGVAAMHPLELNDARINSFVDKHGNDRHDVLLMLKDPSMVEDLGRQCSSWIPHKMITVGTPHVTARICETLQQAEEFMAEIRSYLPIHVTVTGVAID